MNYLQEKCVEELRGLHDLFKTSEANLTPEPQDLHQLKKSTDLLQELITLVWRSGGCLADRVLHARVAVPLRKRCHARTAMRVVLVVIVLVVATQAALQNETAALHAMLARGTLPFPLPRRWRVRARR